MSLLERIWRIPLRYAIVIALPLQIIVLWTALQGYAASARFQAFCESSSGTPPIAPQIEQWRYFARDLFRKDLNRLKIRHFPVSDDLETISLTLKGADLAELNSNLPESGRARYFKAQLAFGDDKRQVKARYMGDNEWHWLFPQKSWRIQTKSDDPLRNRRAFHLKNSPFKMVVSETVVTRLAAELGVLTPTVQPVKTMLNGTYQGLYLFSDLADESLLRRARRMPGSIYRGDTSGVDEDGVCNLFQVETLWEKEASRNAQQVANRSDIRAYIDAINASPLEFYAFAEQHIQMAAMSGFIAIDRALGGQHHDYCHNHRIYFDPYKGRWEPIEWDFGIWHLWRDAPTFDTNEYPILTRLKQHPEYAHQLSKRLYDLLQWLTPKELDRRIDALAARTKTPLAADGMRDYRDDLAQNKLQLKKAPSVTYSMADHQEDIDRRKRGFRSRTEKHRERFEDCRVQYRFEPAAAQQNTPTTTTFELAVNGTAAATLRKLTLDASEEVAMFRDSNLNGVYDLQDERIAVSVPDADGQAEIALREMLYPGLRKQDRPISSKGLHGLFELQPTPLHYRYFLRSNGAVQSVADVELHNSLTGKSVIAANATSLPPATDVYSFHHWLLPRDQPATDATFGPGIVEVTETQRIQAQHVVIAAGTTFRLAADTSLHFFGKVTALGTADQPIRFEQRTPAQPWGVVSLHGRGTEGSRFAHCRWSGGSTADRDLMTRTGMMSVIDTADIVVEDSFIGANFVGDDAMHWGYVTGGVIRNCHFEGARSDAFDLDICEDVSIEGCTFVKSGNDSIDLMTSRIQIDHCNFTDAGDKGVSVGEGTHLKIANSVFENCAIGIEIKDSSSATVANTTRFRHCGIGVNLYRKNLRYGDGGTLEATDLDIEGSKVQDIKWDKRSTVPKHLKQRALQRQKL